MPRSSALFIFCPTRRTFKYGGFQSRLIQMWQLRCRSFSRAASMRGRGHGLRHVSVAASLHCARCRKDGATALRFAAHIAPTERQPHSAALRRFQDRSPYTLVAQRNQPCTGQSPPFWYNITRFHPCGALVKSWKTYSHRGSPNFLEAFALQVQYFAFPTEYEHIFRQLTEPAPKISLKYFRFCY